MANEGDSVPEHTPEPLAKKKTSLRTLIALSVDAFPFTTEHLGTVQGRSLSGPMENALVERLPSKSTLSDLAVSRIFMGCTCGLAGEPNTPVFQPLTPDQADQLTDADVRGFASQYLTNVAKRPESNDVIADFAIYAREQRDRIAQELDKHGQAVRESMRNLSVNSGIMQNWQALQDAVQGPAVRMQRELERAMGPAHRATDAIREALEAIQRPAMATNAMRAIIDSEQARTEHLRSIEGRLQADMDAYRRQLDLVNSSAMERLRNELEGPATRALAELQRQLNPPIATALDEMRRQLEGPAGDALAQMQRQLDSARDLTMERFRTDLASLPDDVDDPDAADTLELELPRLAPIPDTMGRTALAVERLHEVGGRMEAAMGVIVNHAGKASDLIQEVSGTIQTEAREFQKQSEAQTSKAIVYARISLAVSAIALAAGAVIGGLGYSADRAEARSQDADTKVLIRELREQNQKLGALVTAQKVSAPVPASNQMVPTPPKAAPASPRPTNPSRSKKP